MVSTVILGSIFVLSISHQTSQRICVKSRSLQAIVWQKTLVPPCTSSGSAEWSKEIVKIVEVANQRLAPFDYFVTSNKILVTISELDRPVIQGPRQHSIPFPLLENSDLLGYLVIKNWVEEQNETLSQFELLHETLAHFIFFSLTGREALLPNDNASQAPVFWKSVQNHSHANCISDWKLTPKWQLCINRHYQFFETRIDFIKDRLQHKFNLSWTQAYERMTFAEKNQIFRFTLSRIKNYTLDANLLKEASFSNYIKSMSTFWHLNEYFPSQTANKKMLASIIKDFNLINFVNIVDKSRFDLVIFKEGLNLSKFNENEPILKSLRKKETSLVALSNGDDFSIFPIKKTIKISSFSKWYANQIVVESCRPLRMKELMKYTEYTEKLLLIYTCHPLSAAKIAGIAKSGILNYAQLNNEEMFAHFHLPSLVSKKDLIDPHLEVFQFLTQRSQKNSVYELFGWRELNWDQISKTYRPKAIVDAVNLFRVQL